MVRNLFFTVIMAVILSGSQASASEGFSVSCPDSVAAGETFFVEIEAQGSVESLSLSWLGREFRPEYWWSAGRIRARVLLGMGLEDRLEGNRHTLRVNLVTGSGVESREIVLRRVTKEYPEQRLEVSKRFDELSEEILARTARESAEVKRALSVVSAPGRCHLPLHRPVPGKPTSVFGLRRFFNEVPKRSHSGLDLRAAEGDSIQACAAGRVILTGDHFYAGKCVYVDHGQGVVSMYFHLSEILVSEGEELDRGQALGRAGETGRVTGPHLHWGLSVLGQLVDPAPLL